jgi:hypothetical protein
LITTYTTLAVYPDERRNAVVHGSISNLKKDISHHWNAESNSGHHAHQDV